MRGTPQGQKSARLHQQAGHMTASDPRIAAIFFLWSMTA
jgi:hypothetical protein